MAGFALAGAITPGPVNVLALRHGNGRAVAAFCYVLGASVSYAVIVWLMGQSGQWLLKQPELLRWAPRVCAAYLLWLAWQLAKAPEVHGQAARASAPASLPIGPGGAFVQGIAIQSLNPKAWLVALSGIGMFVAPLAAQQVSMPTALLLFCAVSLLACLLGVGCWAALGHALTRWLNTPLRCQRLNQGLAMVLVASVVSMLA